MEKGASHLKCDSDFNVKYRRFSLQFGIDLTATFNATGMDTVFPSA